MPTTTEPFPSPARFRRPVPERFQPRFATLIDIYDHAIRNYPHRPLFGVKKNGEWEWMKYSEFDTSVRAVRAVLAELGVGAGACVGVIANNRPEWAIAAYATYGRRAAFAPMYESQPAKEWVYVLRDCAAQVVFVANARIRDSLLSKRDELPDVRHIIQLDGESVDDVMTFDEVIAKGQGKDVPAERPDPSELAGLIYTSGTTGNQKGVRLLHSNIASNVSAIYEVFPTSPEDVSLSFLPWAHSFGQTTELHLLFSAGGALGIAESVNKIIDNLAEVKPTILFSVPRVFNRIYDGIHKQISNENALRQRVFGAAIENSALRKKLGEERKINGWVDFKHSVFDRLVFEKIRARFGGRLRYAFSGGAAISREVAQFIDNLGITVYEGYGLTETSPVATTNWPGARKIGSVGKPIPGVRIVIDLDATGDPRNGEVIVYGHNVMDGYHGLAEENAKVFTPDGGFRTGDMGYLDEDGFLYITGRIKEQYKLENGKYVAPAHLEDQLKLSPYILNSFIYGDNRLYNVALIVVDLPEVERWASQHDISGRGPGLLTHQKVRALFQAEIDKYSKEAFKHFERIKNFELLTEDFTQENGMLTPKLSLKRRVVMERYGDALEKLYK